MAGWEDPLLSLSRDEILVVGGLALLSLVPIVWAIVDVLRRPFSTGRKAMWVTTMVVGWLLLWPLALVSSLIYLLVLRPRASYRPRVGPGPGPEPVPPPTLPPAGWYRDPSGMPGERWWDGRGWSHHVRQQA